MGTWSDDRLLALLGETADAVVDALTGHSDWSLVDPERGQYVADVVADAAALGVLDAAGVGVVSEESGRRRSDQVVTVVVDPLDGSTNASRGVPWYATSLAAVVDGELRVAVVADLARSRRYEAVLGHGATRDGQPISPSTVTEPRSAMVGLSGYPPAYLGWRQFRAMGAVALDLCAVADGTLDGYMDCSWDAHGVWDYLGAMLVCSEAGAVVAEASGRQLVTLDPAHRRTPVAGATAALAGALLERRRSFTTPGAADAATGAPADR
jgi:fructose-1,6-bisphosphatase/inositol monophosphatase family enzyme